MKKNEIKIILDSNLKNIPEKGDGLLIESNNGSHGFEISNDPTFDKINFNNNLNNNCINNKKNKKNYNIKNHQKNINNNKNNKKNNDRNNEKSFISVKLVRKNKNN